MELINRFPKLELSYETVAHKKVSPNYDICISIPNGKKTFMWFTFHEDADVCYLLDINKDHKVTKVANIATNNFDHQLAYGTILYGSLCEVNEKQVFIIEDMYYFCGLLVKHLTFGEKLTYYKTFMMMITKKHMSIKVALPFMCMVEGDNALLESLPFYESMTSKTAYTSHHVQFRSSKTVAPYLNHVYKKRCVEKVECDEDAPLLFPRNDLDHYVQMNLKSAVFRVMADIQNDVYHLFAYDGYTNIAYIGSRDSSVYMNKLFRNIRENTNVDYGEESEDEDIFQNTSLDKYVDLKKEYKMHCVYNAKFKKWVPVHVVDDKSRLVSLKDLLRSHVNAGYNPNTNAGYTPHTNAGYTPHTNAGYKPHTNAGYKPHTNGYKPHTNAGYKPHTNAGYKPNTNAGYTPHTNAGYKPHTNAGYKPHTNAGYKSYKTFSKNVHK